MSLKTDTALAIGKSIARSIGVPISELTKDMVRKAPIPVRFKKLFFGPNTPGETRIAPSIKSSRAVAIKEVKALGTGAVMGALGANVTNQIMSAVKDSEKKKAKPNVRVGIKTGTKKKQKTGTGNKGRNKPRTPVNRAVASAKKAVASPPKKKTTKPKPRPKKPIPRVRPRMRPGS